MRNRSSIPLPGRAVCVLLACALLALFAKPAWSVTVYATESGFGPVNNGPVDLTPGASTTLEVYIHQGNTAGVSYCRPGGTGDALCGYDVVLKLEGDGYLGSFAPAAGVTVFPGTFTTVTRELRAVFLGAEPAPTTTDPILIGLLTVEGTTIATSVLAAPAFATGAQLADWSGGNRALLASLDLAVIPENLIAVPEAGSGVLWLGGLPGLAAIFAWHTRRRRHAHRIR